MRYVLIGVNNDGGRKATIHNTLEEVKSEVRAYLFDPRNFPKMTEEERSSVEADLSYLDDEIDCVHSIRGYMAWKEWLYVSPLEDPRE